MRKCNLQKNDKILDIPCGTGTLATVFAKFPACIIAADISLEMMNLAREEYRGMIFEGFIQADITKTPFRPETYTCVIVLGFMHRVPVSIRQQTLKEITSLSKRFIIISYSIDSPSQRLKQWLIKKIRPAHKSAPLPVSLRDLIEEFRSQDLDVRKLFKVFPFLSAEVIFLLERKK